MPASTQHHTPEVRVQLDAVIDQFAALSDWCCRHSLLILVPMGQEFAYRYQEALSADLLYALQAFRDRLER